MILFIMLLQFLFVLAELSILAYLLMTGATGIIAGDYSFLNFMCLTVFAVGASTFVKRGSAIEIERVDETERQD